MLNVFGEETYKQICVLQTQIEVLYGKQQVTQNLTSDISPNELAHHGINNILIQQITDQLTNLVKEWVETHPETDVVKEWVETQLAHCRELGHYDVITYYIYEYRDGVSVPVEKHTAIYKGSGNFPDRMLSSH